jgi:mannose-6-phosphate isomerase-like protein (cupin superfamily)
MATSSAATARTARHVPVSEREPILRGETREIDLLLASENVTITHARYAPGERVAGPHVHRRHIDAFYVLEGELTFEVGRERETITVGTGSLVAAPAGVAHSFRTAGGRPARWLTIHAPDGGFASFMRGVRDGVQVAWDIASVPAAGGLPARRAVISRPELRA